MHSPLLTKQIDLHHLRFAIAAADYGSFRRASDVLSVRHSVLSRSIGQLEHIVGVPLFERSSGGARPTPAARQILRLARIILEQVDTLVTTGRSNSRGEAGHLAVGFCTSISAGNLRATLLDFKERFPEVELTTAERSRSCLVTALHNGRLDLLLVTGEMNLLDKIVLPLWSERILVCLREDHGLAARDVVYWTDLRGETVLISQYDPGCELDDLLVPKLMCAEEHPKIERHDVSRGNIKNLVSMGFGIGLVLESDIEGSFTGLVYRELHDGAGPSRIGFYAHWRHDNENPTLKRFLNLLAERYPSPPPVPGE